MRPTGPRSPLNITRMAFSLYHTPLRDSAGLYSAIVDMLQPNPCFSTARPTLISPPPISATLPAFAVAVAPSLSGTHHPYLLLPLIPISPTVPEPTALRSAIVQPYHSQSFDQYSRLLPRYAANKSSSQVFRTSFLCHWLLWHPLRTNSTLPTSQSIPYPSSFVSNHNPTP